MSGVGTLVLVMGPASRRHRCTWSKESEGILGFCDELQADVHTVKFNEMPLPMLGMSD